MALSFRLDPSGIALDHLVDNTLALEQIRIDLRMQISQGHHRKELVRIQGQAVICENVGVYVELVHDVLD
ncbi:hypothetical protein D3C80_1846980 [compost metagenome]